MTREQQRNNLIAKDVFAVANMAAHYDIEIPEDLEDFMMDWFSLDPHQPTEYTFDELKEFAVVVLDIVDKNPRIEREIMIRFALSELRNLVGKSESEIDKEKSSQMELWSDMDNFPSMGMSAFMKKHGSNRELLEAQAVIAAMFPH